LPKEAIEMHGKPDVLEGEGGMTTKPHQQRCETCKNVVDSKVRIGYKKCKLSNMLLNSNFDVFEHSSIVGCASWQQV
jgi:hypothetical protein